MTSSDLLLWFLLVLSTLLGALLPLSGYFGVSNHGISGYGSSDVLNDVRSGVCKWVYWQGIGS